MSRQSIKVLNNKKIAMLGFGIENQVLIDYLAKKKIKAEIVVYDARERSDFAHANKIYSNIQWRSEKSYNQEPEKFDILFRSPGWPLKQIKSGKLRKKSELSSPMKLFFDLCPSKNIIGVTGTKGKGTTASLIAAILKIAGKRVWLGGNIGIAPFSFIGKIKVDDWVVLELSSFHLEDMDVSPKIAVFTNFSKEHLSAADPRNPNFHKNLSAYWQAKMNILRWQNKADSAVVNIRLRKRIEKLRLSSKIYYFKKSNLSSSLIGEHNKENIAAAEFVAHLTGVPQSLTARAVKNFSGLEHRLEFIAEKNGIRYYDDSFATTPEAAIIALKSFSAPIILLAGGADKGANFLAFAKEIKKRAKYVILLAGAATTKIQAALEESKYERERMQLAQSLDEAVRIMKRQSQRGDVVLLSTGCASFGMFRNYKERGSLFKERIRKL
jgi:UDP-N-acetylmuramoylalanine--D-glutamate ligase